MAAASADHDDKNDNTNNNTNNDYLSQKTGIVVFSLLSSLEHYLRIVGKTTIILTVIVKKQEYW